MLASRAKVVRRGRARRRGVPSSSTSIQTCRQSLLAFVQTLQTRELLTLSMLATLGGCDAQVKGHVAANLNVGNDRARTAERAHRAHPLHRLPPRPQRSAGA